MKSTFLVLVQFACLLYLFLSGSVISENYALVGIQFIALFIGLWAVRIMNPFRVSVFPEPKDNAVLIQEGPYAFIRHPMYSAIVFGCLPMVIDRMDAISAIVYSILIVNLVFKMNHEEGLLKQHFNTYEAYMNRTKRIIPFIY